MNTPRDFSSAFSAARLEQMRDTTKEGIEKVRQFVASHHQKKTCPECGTEMTVSERETVIASMHHGKISERIELRFESCLECYEREIMIARGAPPAVIHGTIENWVGSRLIQDKVMTFAARDRGFLIISSKSPGVGKTHLGVGVMRKNLLRSWFFSHPDIAAVKDFAGQAQIEKRAKGTSVLILDDLAYSCGRILDHEVIERVIHHRHSHRLATVITTNLGADELAEWLGPRNKDRVMEQLFAWIPIEGSSKRKTMARHLPSP